MPFDRQAALAHAEKLVARGKLDAAIKEYRKLHQDNPTDLATANRLGDLLVRKEAMREAVELFQRVARQYVEDGFHVKAIAILKKILKLDPTRFEVYEQLADLYHRQGLRPEALAQWQVLFEYYQKHGRREEAERVLERIVEISPEDPAPRAKLAELHLQAGRTDRALAGYKAISDLMLRSGRLDDAVQVLTRAISLAPEDLTFITEAVLGLKDLGHVGAAARLLSFAVPKNPQAERIARLAGLRDRGPASGVEAPPKPPVAEPSVPGPPPVQATGSVKIEEGLELEIELPAEGDVPETQVRVTEEMLARSPDSPWVDRPAVLDAPLDGELEAPLGDLDIELELDLPGAVPPAEATPQPLEADRPTSGSFEWSFEPGMLDLPAPDLTEVVPVPIPNDQAGVELDLDALERTSYEVVEEAKPVARRLDELVAEAEVLAKYSLIPKAQDKLREVLEADPRHLGALALQVNLFLDEGKTERVLAPARQLAHLAKERGDRINWEPVYQRLLKAGFRFEGEVPIAIPEAPATRTKVRSDSVSILLAELMGTPEPERPPAKAETGARASSGVADLLAQLESDLRESKQRPEKKRTTPPAHPSVAPEAPKVELPRPAEPAAAPPVPPVESGPAPAPAGESPLAWLDRAATPKPAEAPVEESLFDEEEGFFDLAAELERELSADELVEADSLAAPQEQSLEEIVEGFKKGVAESLSPEDYDTHFNLGIAYREMGLLDEAIGEFQLAAKSPQYLVDCCSLLGACFHEKGLPDLAVRWYQKGLSAPNLPEEATLGLLYDLGNLYQSIGEVDKARKTFVEIYGSNSNYRDVVARLEELGGSDHS